MLLLIAVAFVAGVVTALSPCVLPALPVVLAGGAGGGPRRVAGIAMGFVATFTLVTVALATALRSAGLSAGALRNVAIAVLVGVGATLVVPALGARVAAVLAPVARLGERVPRGRSGLAGGLLVGMALGLVWTPCAGPVFAAIAVIAATGDAGLSAVVVLTAYAVGAVLPLCLIAAGGRRVLGRMRGRRAAAVRPALGVAMIAAAAIVALGLDTRLTTYVVRDVPAYTDALQALERTPGVTRALAELRPGAPTDIPPFLAAVRGAEGVGALRLPDAGPAPELRGITATYNAGEEPLTLASLRGRVVLVDFWTYSCVNCLRTIPRLQALQERYRGDGLTVLGVHTPEFAFEADAGNVGDAVRDLGITYPVALDPDFATWEAFGTRYWPTTYLIDRTGRVRDLHVGEGDEERTEDYLRRALGVPADAPAADEAGEAPPEFRSVTPETWVGAARIRRLAPGQRVRPLLPTRYEAPAALAPDAVAFDGEWTLDDESARAGEGAAIELAYRARNVNLVLDGGDGGPRTGQVLIDGRVPGAGEAGRDVGPGGALAVGAPRLYRLLEFPGSSEGTIRIELAPGTRAFAFSFG